MTTAEQCSWIFKGDPVYIWFENNSQSLLDDWKLVARDWQTIGALISTSRESATGRVVDFANQALAVDGVDDVISGFKTSDFFDFAGGDSPYDTSIWQEIRDLADSVSTATGGNPVVLDNETNMTNLKDDWGTAISETTLASAIQAVTGDWPEIWHWPSTVGETEPLRQLHWDWAQGLSDGIADLNLIESSSAGLTTTPGYGPAQVNLGRTLAIDPVPYSIVYLDDVTSNFWRLRNAWESRQYVAGQGTILYPGAGDINNFALVQEGYAIAEAHRKACRGGGLGQKGRNKRQRYVVETEQGFKVFGSEQEALNELDALKKAKSPQKQDNRPAVKVKIRRGAPSGLLPLNKKI